MKSDFKKKLIRLLIILLVFGIIAAVVYYLILKPLGIELPALTRKKRWQRYYSIHGYANWAYQNPWQELIKDVAAVLSADGTPALLASKPKIENWADSDVLKRAVTNNAVSAYDQGELASNPAYIEAFETWWTNVSPKGEPPVIGETIIGIPL